MDVVSRIKAKAELKEFIRGCGHSWQDAFRLMDVNGVAHLSQDDFSKGLALLGFSEGDTSAFSDIDTDGDGIASLQDFGVYFKEEATSMRSTASGDMMSSPASATPLCDAGCPVAVDERMHEAMLDAIDDRLRHLVDQAVGQAFSKLQRDEDFGLSSQSLPGMSSQTLPRGISSQTLAPQDRIEGGISVGLKDTLESIWKQMMEFASAISGFTDEIDKANQRIAEVQDQCIMLSHDLKSVESLSRSTALQVEQSRDVGATVEAERLEVHKLRLELLAQSKEDLCELRSAIEANNASFSQLQESVYDEQVKVKLLFDNSAFMSMRLDLLQKQGFGEVAELASIPLPRSDSPTYTQAVTNHATHLPAQDTLTRTSSSTTPMRSGRQMQSASAPPQVYSQWKFPSGGSRSPAATSRSPSNTSRSVTAPISHPGCLKGTSGLRTASSRGTSVDQQFSRVPTARNGSIERAGLAQQVQGMARTVQSARRHASPLVSHTMAAPATSRESTSNSQPRQMETIKQHMESMVRTLLDQDKVASQHGSAHYPARLPQAALLQGQPSFASVPAASYTQALPSSRSASVQRREAVVLH